MDFLPMPHKLSRGEGAYAIDLSRVIVLEDTEPAALLYAQLLRDEILKRTGLRLSILRGKGRVGDMILCRDESLASEVYHLTVSPEGVKVSAGSDEALLHGVQTLRQWVQRHGAFLPAITVEDWPDLKYRGYYLDCSRGRVPTLETLKGYADLLCRYKINEWQLYIEHTYLFRDLSEAWRDETPLTAEEIMELDAYCRARHIELIPSLSTFGHMYKILSTKTCCELCELEDSEKRRFSYTYAGDHHTLNVSSDRALGFIQQLIEEYMALFTSRKFNICADETFDLGKGRSKALAEEKGEQELYMTHVTALCRFLIDRGHTPMFWGDIMWRHPEAYPLLPKETICLNWGYLPNQRENEIRDLAQMGATQYACPGVCTWNRWIPLLEDSFSNNRVMCAHGKKYGAIGLLNTDWGDYGHICQPQFSVPGILYGAAFAWNADNIAFDEVNRAISYLEYGDETGAFMEHFVELSRHEVFDWFHAVRWIEQTDAQKRHELFAEVKVEEIPAANAAIRRAMDQLLTTAPHMDADKRDVLQALSLAAQGALLFNEIALHIAKRVEHRDMDAPAPLALATALETWYRAYLLQWRVVSKESTVRHTLKIVTDYADMLRGRKSN